MHTNLEIMNTQIFQDFLPHIRFIGNIGEGAFAQVFLIYDQKQKIHLAVKKISLFGLCQYQRKLVLNQAKILSSIQHPNIIQFHSCFYDNNDQNVYIFMEFARQGDLLNLIYKTRLQRGQIKQSVIWSILGDISQGLNYLHSKGIIHRDVKPANILRQDNSFKLADMNVSKIKQDGKMTRTNIGTPLYTSPQVARNQFYNEKCDIWSLGVVIYQLCCLKNPFDMASLNNLGWGQQRTAIQKIPLRYSKGLSDVIKKMLNKNPSQRISIKQIVQTCRMQGVNAKYISSQTIGDFKTIVFPLTSQRWVNLVQYKEHKQDLDLTIDQIIRDSELKQHLTTNKKIERFLHKQSKYKESVFKYTQSINLVQDEYCLNSTGCRSNMLRADQNIQKINNYMREQRESKDKNKARPINSRPKLIRESQSLQNRVRKSISTQKSRNLSRQSSKQKPLLPSSREKHRSQYGFKFIKLSRDLQSLQN